MPNVVIVEKLGSLKSLQIKNFVEADLFKKAGFKSPNDFDLQTVWTVDAPVGGGGGTVKQYSVYLYAKKSGRAGQENKYEFPPPVDKLLYFGNCVLVNKPPSLKDGVGDLTIAEWKYISDKLFGGFEDIDDETEENESDESEELDVPKTKNGYVKDGFVVDDDDEEDEDEDKEEDDEEDEDDFTDEEPQKIPPPPPSPPAIKKEKKITTPKPRQPTKKKASGVSAKTPKNNAEDEDGDETQNTETELYLDCTNELTEEEYIPIHRKR